MPAHFKIEQLLNLDTEQIRKKKERRIARMETRNLFLESQNRQTYRNEYDELDGEFGNRSEIKRKHGERVANLTALAIRHRQGKFKDLHKKSITPVKHKIENGKCKCIIYKMLTGGLRRKPIFMDLVKDLAKPAYIPRFPNRDAKKRGNGFVFSQYDEENAVLMDQQQLNVVNVATHQLLVKQAAMEAGISVSELALTADFSHQQPFVAKQIFEAPDFEETMQDLRIQDQAIKDFEQKRLFKKRDDIVSRFSEEMMGKLFRDTDEPGMEPEPSGPDLPVFPNALEAGTIEAYQYIKDNITWWVDKLPSSFGYKEVKSMVEKYNDIIPEELSIPIIAANTREEQTRAKKLMMMSLKMRFKGVKRKMYSTSGASSSH